MRTTPLALLAASALALSACGPDEQTQKADAAQDKLRANETVAAAASKPWPAPADQKIDAFDPVRTRDNLMVALDMSGSMHYSDCAGDYPSKAAAAKDALKIWLQGVPETANLGLSAFTGGQSKVYVRLGTKNRERFMSTVDSLQPDGGTPLAEIVDLSEDELERQARYQQGYGSYRIVVITDGEHSGGYDPRPVVETILGNPANPVEIYTIGFCVDANHALNQPGLTEYRSATNPAELRAGLESVLAESETFSPSDFEALSKDTAGN